jgi:hypothetical protein
VGQDPRLARAGTGQDEQRALGRGDGAGLLRVQGPDDLLSTPGAAGGDGRRIEWRHRGLRRHRGSRAGDRGLGALAQPLGLFGDGRIGRLVGVIKLGTDGRQGVIERRLAAAATG